MSGSGLIGLNQIKDITTDADLDNLGNAHPGLATTLDLLAVVKGQGYWHPASVPINTATGGLEVSSNKFRVKTDGTTTAIVGGSVTVPYLDTGGFVPGANLPLAANMGLFLSSGSLAVKVDATSNTLSLSSNGVKVVDGSTSQKGAFSIDAAHGLTVTSGVLGVDLKTTTPATVEGEVRFETTTGKLGIRQYAYLRLDAVNTAAYAPLAQVIDTAVAITGAYNFGFGPYNLVLLGGKIGGCGAGTLPDDVVTKTQLDAGLAGVGNQVGPVVGFTDGTQTASGNIVTGERLVATVANVYSLGNAAGDILTCETDDVLTDASFVAPDGNTRLYSSGTAPWDGDNTYAQPGVWTFNTTDNLWYLTQPDQATAMAVDVATGGGVQGGVKPWKGLTVNVGGQLQVKLAAAGGLLFTAASGENDDLSIKLDGATLALSSSGLKIPASGVTATEIAAGTITPTKLAYAANSGLIETGAGLGIKLKAVSGLAINGSDELYADALQFSMLTTDESLYDAGSGAIGVHFDVSMFELDVSDGLRFLAGGVLPAHLALGDGLEDNGSSELQINAAAPFTFTAGALDLAAAGVKAAKIDVSSSTSCLGASGNSLTVVTVAAGGLEKTATGLQILAGGVKPAMLALDAASALVTNGSDQLKVDVDGTTVKVASQKLAINQAKYQVVAGYQGTAIPAPSGANYAFNLATHANYPAGGTLNSTAATIKMSINGIPVGAASISIAGNVVTLLTDPTKVNPDYVPYTLDRTSTGDCVIIIGNFT